MTLVRSLTSAAAPSVGIFWGVAESGTIVIVTDATSLTKAERYGDFLTHPGGHYEVWEGWRRLRPAVLRQRGLPAAVAFSEYESRPRGRIVFETQSRTFIVYADRKLQTGPVLSCIVEAFALRGEKVDVRSDAHYRT